jgi:Putative Actinobacterial Holin-X, holin superfamily III
MPEGEDMARTEPEPGARPSVRMARVLRYGVRPMLRKDVELARQEIAGKVKKAGIGAGMFGVAGILGLAALGAFTTAVILASRRR